MKRTPTLLGCVLLVLACSASLAAKPLHHYVFFGQDQSIPIRIIDANVLGTLGALEE